MLTKHNVYPSWVRLKDNYKLSGIKMLVQEKVRTVATVELCIILDMPAPIFIEQTKVYTQQRVKVWAA
jgi:hypothetical protein